MLEFLVFPATRPQTNFTELLLVCVCVFARVCVCVCVCVCQDAKLRHLLLYNDVSSILAHIRKPAQKCTLNSTHW